MPGSFDNVVLAYQHPYIATYLEDNTIYNDTDTVSVPTPAFNGIQVGFFGAGRDNVILYSTNTNMFIEEYGKPNYKLYGQAAYNAVAALDTNQCGMYTLRLLPDDATYANCVIMVDWKVETPIEGDNPKPQLCIKFRKASVTGAKTVAALKTGIAAMYGTELDDEGYNTAPLMSFWQLGRGTYGNSTRLKFADTMDYDSDTNTYRYYELDVMEFAKTGLTTKENITGCVQDGILELVNENNPSMFMEDLVNDPEYGSKKINMMVHSDTYEQIVAAYNEAVANYTADDGITVLNEETLDVIMGLYMDGTENPVINMVDNSTAADYLNPISVDGFTLENGTNGALDGSDATAVEQVKSELLIKAFRGEIDRKLTSRFGTPADFCMDANFPEEVKREMASFAAKREYDAMTYIDSGTMTSSSEIINFLTGLKSITAYNLVKECGTYNFRDVEYTGKIIPMSITHWLSKALPKHISIESYSTPFAREDARLQSGTDFVAGTFFPQINPDDNEVKKQIFKLGANCYETISNGVVQRSTGITTCTTNSDRKLEFNEYILHRAVKIAYDILNSKLYKIGEEADRLQYQTHAEKEISYQLAAYLRSVTVEFVMSKKDEQRSIMRLRMRLVFRTVITRGILEIYLDPRTGTVTDTTTTASTTATAV